MKIEIKNIGKISKAEVELEGITVIAGKNNTGKSTVGKALYAMIDFLYGYKQYVENDIRSTMFRYLNEYGESLEVICKEYFEGTGRFRRKPSKINNIVTTYEEALYNCFVKHEKKRVKKIFQEYAKEYISIYKSNKIKCENDAMIRLDNVYNEVIQFWNIKDGEVGIGKATNAFDGVFNSQINNMRNADDEAYVKFQDDFQKVSEVFFKNNLCIWKEYNTPVFDLAYYVENPRCLDIINRTPRYYDDIWDRFTKQRMQDIMRQRFKAILRPYGLNSRHMPISLRKKNQNDEEYISDLDIALLQKKQEEILKLINKAVPGKYNYENGIVKYSEPNTDYSLKLENLSTGLKSMILIERMISLGLLCEGSILILDEPEINVHPEWQVLYANIIVMLQQIYNAKIVITTHSPYFIKAIKSYAIKEKTLEKCRFYLAEDVDGVCEINDVTKNTNLIFKELADPIKDLKEMEYE